MISRTAIQEYVKSNALTDLLAGILGSLFISLAAQMAITIPWLTLVPFTFQVPAVMVLAALLGGRKAMLAVSFYLFEGACGYPVLAHGTGGLTRLFGPTGGYLFACLPVSFLVGCAFERIGHRNLRVNCLVLLAGGAAILTCGMIWLSLFTGKLAWDLGVKPFLLSDALKMCAVAILLTLDRRHSGR